jgi:Tol biopolymer transport system component
MTPDDWGRIKTIACDAWSQPAAERPAYIISRCENDPGLQREVESLVAAMAAADDRLEVPPDLPFEDSGGPISLAGTRLGAYEILSPIGAGGMGEVYKARDTRLDRTVAIKVLLPSAAVDPAARDRLEREARAIAALNHPHICTLHDIQHEAGIDFLVMEYVSGESLAVRLARGPLPVSEALQYAEQIAQALLEAHRAGLVHRDVKPGNIMLDDAGLRSGGTHVAKLLDFGLAKADASRLSSTAIESGQGGSLDVTLEGFAMGTTPYMAPEQFIGHTPDGRTDIFAFGAVLFEMLTGRKAFNAPNRAEVAAAIRDEGTGVPRVTQFRSQVPPQLDRIVLKCLARDPNDRYQSADDLLGDLRMVRLRLDSSGKRGVMVAACTAAALVMIAGFSAWAVWGRDAAHTTAPTRSRLAASAGVLGAPALSPDGNRLVFSWSGEGVENPELVLLAIGSTDRVRLTNDPGVEDWPAWSPDGTRIAFVRCGGGQCGIFTLRINDRSEQKVRDLKDDRYYGLAWSPDGHSIAYAERASPSDPFQVFLLSLDKFEVRRVSNPRRGTGDLRFALSPDGRTLAVVRLADTIGVSLVSIETGEEKPLLAGQKEWFGGITWGADGRKLILSANQQGVRRLWTLPISGGGLEQLAIAGEDSYFPSLSVDGSRLTFVRDLRDWDLARTTMDDGRLHPSVPFLSSPRIDLDPVFAPDGQRLAFVSERGGTREVWVSNSDASAARPLTSVQAAGYPSWSPDGKWLAFHSAGIQVVSTAGGPVRRITEDGEMPVWSADGKSIYFRRATNGGLQIWKVPFEAGAAVRATEGMTSSAQEDSQGTNLYFTPSHGGIWRRLIAGGDETVIVPDFNWALCGYWKVFDDGIYYVVRESLSDRSIANHLRFMSFTSRRTVDLGTLNGTIDDWVGGLTISKDRRTVLYVQSTYQSSEVVLVDHFR